MKFGGIKDVFGLKWIGLGLMTVSLGVIVTKCAPEGMMNRAYKKGVKFCSSQLSTLEDAMSDEGVDKVLKAKSKAQKKLNECRIKEKEYKEGPKILRRFKSLCRKTEGMAFNDKKKKCVKYRGRR